MSKIEIDRAVMQQTLDALEYAHATNRYESARQDRSITALRKALASYQPAKCWKCGDTDPAFQSACDVPSCGMREVLAAANPPESGGITPDWKLPPLPEPGKKQGQQMSYDGDDKVFFDCYDNAQMAQYAKDAINLNINAALAAPNSVEFDGIRTEPAQQKPVLFIHPDTFAMANAHVGAWKPGHELPGYIPLYTAPQPAPKPEPDALHMVIMDLARKQSDRIAELESTAAEFKFVGWAISYDGQTPYRIWYEGDGEMLDLEVRRIGGTACKMGLFAKVKK